MQKIYLGADHRGFQLKEELKSWLAAAGHEVQDVGNTSYDENDDYPDYSFQVAESVTADENAVGVLVCGSGVGVNVAANKVKGARASLAMIPLQAEHARAFDDVNVLALAADYLTPEEARQIVESFLSQKFQGKERQQRRVNKIEAYEQK